MTTTKNLFLRKSAAFLGLAILSASAMAQIPADLASGEVRKIDESTQKITLKHGEIKNLDMPAMTMVFQVKDPALLGQVKVGDKVQFHAVQQGGAIVVIALIPE